MYSLIFAIYPRDGMSAAECGDYVTNVHSMIGARMPKAKALRQFVVTGSHEPRDADIAAFTLLEFDSEDEFNEAAASSVMEEANADIPNFADHIAVYNVRGKTVI